MKTCPNCESDEIMVYASTLWHLNTMEFYRHTSKAHDSDADYYCKSCNWEGLHNELGDKGIREALRE